MRGDDRSSFAGLLLCLVCVLLVHAQASARTVRYQAKDGTVYRLRSPDGFSKFQPVPPVVIRASNTVVNRLNERQWAAVKAYKILGILGGAEDRKGASFERKVKGDRIFILFFNRDYPFEVLGGIDMKRKKQEVVAMLGAPQFENKELRLFGYKGTQYYVFFKGEEALEGIAVYPRDTDAEKAVPDKHYSAGVQIDDYVTAGKRTCDDVWTIFNNYEGRIMSDLSLPRDYARLIEIIRSAPELPPGDEDILLVPDADLVFSYECERETKVAADVRNGILSPGRQRVLAYDGCSGGNANITINDLDSFHSEIKQYTGFLSTWTWLNDRYVMYCVQNAREPITIFDSFNRTAFPLKGQEFDTRMIYKVLSTGNGRLVYEAGSDPESSEAVLPASGSYEEIYEALAEKYEQPFSFDAGGKIVFGERHRLTR